MNERLEKLRYALGLEWGELAEKLGIGRAMLGFIRKGDRKPSAALMRRIADLEASISSHIVANEENALEWRDRALKAEQKLQRIKMLVRQLQKEVDDI